MTDVALLISDMVTAGVDPAIIGRVAAALAERAAPVILKDDQAERRRSRDRDRKRLRKSADSADSAENPLPPFNPPLPFPQTPFPSPPYNPPSPQGARHDAALSFQEGWERFREIYPGSRRTDLGAQAFADQVAEGATPDLLVAALTAKIAELKSEQRSLGFIGEDHRWLRLGKWKPYGEKVVARAGPNGWTGPPEIRAQVVAEAGEAFAKSYLDTAQWEPVFKIIITPYDIGKTKLQTLQCLGEMQIHWKKGKVA